MSPRVRRAFFLFALIAIGVAGWKWGPGAWRQAQILYVQRQMMNYTLPTDHVVYESDPIAATELLKRKDYEILRSVMTSHHIAGWSPAIVRRAVVTGVLPWGTGATIFMHERTAPNGNRRLVIVTTNDFFDTYPLDPYVIKPATWQESPQIAPLVVGYYIRFKPFFLTANVSNESIINSKHTGFGIPGITSTRIFAGQPDHNDASRFSIRFICEGREGLVEGQLGDDNSVMLNVAEVFTAERFQD
jgi:hypothetical protein